MLLGNRFLALMISTNHSLTDSPRFISRPPSPSSPESRSRSPSRTLKFIVAEGKEGGLRSEGRFPVSDVTLAFLNIGYHDLSVHPIPVCHVVMPVFVASIVVGCVGTVWDRAMMTRVGPV